MGYKKLQNSGISDRSVKNMADVVIGDVVQVARPGAGPDGTTSTGVKHKMKYTYSAVIGFSHRFRHVTCKCFVTLITDDGSSWTMTPGHYTYAPTMRYALDVRVGVRVHGLDGERVIVDVLNALTDTGLANPNTEEGTIVVDGVVQSCDMDIVEIDKAHALLAQVRAVIKVMPTRLRQRVALDIEDREEKDWQSGLRMLFSLVRSRS